MWLLLLVTIMSGWSGIIKDDFLVNQDTVGCCEKSSPYISVSGNGDFSVVWGDQRNGENDIYMQKFLSDRTPIKPNLRVNDDPGLTKQYPPAVAVDEGGNSVVVWEEFPSRAKVAVRELYGQLFDPEQNPVRNNFLIAQVTPLPVGKPIGVAKNKTGQFVMVWLEKEIPQYRVACRTYDQTGEPLTSRFLVREDTVSMAEPGAVFTDSAYIVVIWIEKGSIYGQLLDLDGTLVGEKFRVSDDSLSGYCSIAADSSGKFTVAWRMNENIYVQRFDKSGNRLGGNFKLTNDITGYRRYSYIAISGNGNAVVAWIEKREGDSYICCQRLDQNGTLVGGDTKLSGPVNPGVSKKFVGMDDQAVFTVAWVDESQGYPLLYAQPYSFSTCSPIGDAIKVNDDVGSFHQEFCAVASDTSSSFKVSWSSGDGNVYLACLDKTGNPLRDNILMGRGGGGFGSSPSLAVDGQGDGVVSWGGVVAQRFDKTGDKIGDTIMVVDRLDTGTVFIGWPTATMNRAGDFIIVWEENNSAETHSYLWAQRFDRNGNRIGHNFKVNENTIWLAGRPPSAVLFEDNSFIVCFAQEYSPYSYITLRRFNSNGEPLGPSYRIDEAPAGGDFPAIASNVHGEFVAVWLSSSYGICGQLFDSAGTPVGNNFALLDSKHCEEFLLSKNTPSVAIDDSGKFIVFWSDNRNPDDDPEVTAQLFNVDGTPRGTTIQINNQDFFSYNHQLTTQQGVAATTKNIVFAWMDNRRHKGWDIYAKITDWDIVGIDESVERRAYGGRLTVFPNPARQIASINFTLSESGPVSLKIYDACGRLVQTLIQERLKDGEHTFKLSTENLPQGVYFIELKRDEKRDTEKLLILR